MAFIQSTVLRHASLQRSYLTSRGLYTVTSKCSYTFDSSSLNLPISKCHYTQLFCIHKQTHRHTLHSFQRLVHSESENSKSDTRKSAFRNRIIAYIGGFVVLHLCVVFGRHYYKKQGKTSQLEESGSSSEQEYVDRDLGKSAKMFHYKAFLLPSFAKSSLQKIEDFEVRENDFIVSSFPKSGTTWVQEMVYQIVNIDVKNAPVGNMEERFPYLEFIYPGLREIARQQGQRLIKTHMPYELLPSEARAGKCKVIYIARNPKDVSVSYFHYVRMLSEVGFNGNYEHFFEKFINDKVAYGPWWKHVIDFWEHRDDPHILFLTYEGLQKDLLGSIEKVAQFLGCNLTPSQIKTVAHRCSFTAMKRNPDTNYSWWDNLGLRRAEESAFMRKGVVGDWKNYCTPDMIQQMDEMCKQRLEPKGLTFVDSLN